jgi:inosose dehydratase
MLGAYADGCGVRLAWHQHWGSLFEVEANLHRLLELTDPALVGFCPDVGQLALCGFDVLATVRRYVERIAFVHYKDVTFAGRPRGELWPGGPVAPRDQGAYGIDSRGRWVELGRGVVDFPAITQVLRSAGYDGWLMDDFDYTGYPARDAAQACKDYINNGLGIWSERDKRRGLAPRDAR